MHGGIMRELKFVAFDLGGVLAYRDVSSLTDEEKALLDIYHDYMRKELNQKDYSLLEYARSKMSDIYLKIHKLSKYAIPTLDMLKQEKIGISIWTNNNPYIVPWLHNSGLLEYLPEHLFINSFYLGYDKPDSEFYLACLNILEMLPSNVLFLDDSLKNVVGARNCGIDTILYDMSMDLFGVVEGAIRERKLK